MRPLSVDMGRIYLNLDTKEVLYQTPLDSDNATYLTLNISGLIENTIKEKQIKY